MQAVVWAPGIAILAVIGIIYGSLACLAQTDMKRLIAFSSVGHMGFVMLGIATLTDIGINASVIGMVAHGLITGLLFFLAGSMSHRYHTREMARLGGNLKLMPILGGILAFTAMASLGLPGLAGFWGEFMSLLGSYNPLEGLPLGVFRTPMVLGAIGTVLTAGYMLWMLQRVNLGEPNAEWEGHEFHDADRFELAAWVPLIVLIVAIGVFPRSHLRHDHRHVDGRHGARRPGRHGSLDHCEGRLTLMGYEIDYLALAPELVIVATLVLVLALDLLLPRDKEVLGGHRRCGRGRPRRRSRWCMLAIDGETGLDDVDGSLRRRRVRPGR